MGDATARTSDDGHVLDDAEIRRRLLSGSAAALAFDRKGLDAAHAWLAGISAAELLRVDGLARQWRWGGSALGKAQQWSKGVMNNPDTVVAALASMQLMVSCESGLWPGWRHPMTDWPIALWRCD